MGKDKTLRRTKMMIEAMKFIEENYDVLTDENVPLETITATEMLMEKLWDEYSDDEISTIARMVGLDWC